MVNTSIHFSFQCDYINHYDTYIHGTQELLGVGDAKGKKLKFDNAAL